MDIDIENLLNILFDSYDGYEASEDFIVYVSSVVFKNGTPYDAVELNLEDFTVTCITKKVFNLNLTLTPAVSLTPDA